MAFASLVVACSFDEAGVDYSGGDGIVGPDAPASADASATDGGADPDAAPTVDAAEPCTGNGFECLANGSARVCHGGHWVGLGACPLGCDEVARQCRVPSNVPAEWLGAGNGEVILTTAHSPITIDTDTGAIRINSSATFRPAMTGLHAGSGIWYGQLDQGEDAPSLGVFAMQSFELGAGATVNVEGERALVLLLTESATVGGIVLATADADEAGPGGYGGGEPDGPGHGPCGGEVGYGEQVDEGGCASGSGGGGHGGAGGPGGDSTCGGAWDGGDGGDNTCGTPELVPLAGGSGGAGGAEFFDGAYTHPGAGGGGGGAIQISAGDAVVFSVSGGINAGGGGGGACTGAGGAGGGAGGAILIEAPSVELAFGSALAANGGGGGGGDCT